MSRPAVWLAIAIGSVVLGSIAFATAATESDDVKPLAGQQGIWISKSEIALRPTEGPGWEAVVAHTKKSTASPNLANQDDPTNVRVLAKAIVFARLGDETHRRDVRRALQQVRGTERTASALAVGRELMAYVVAADLIGLEGRERADFENWLRRIQVQNFGGRTLRSTHEDRPNNWGTHAGASRLAIAIYLGDREEIQRSAEVFRGWLGERDAYHGFEFGEGDWQARFFVRYAVNPAGASIRGHSVDGVLPDDQRRGGEFAWPPPKENYVYEALQGAIAQAVMLSRLGYPVWAWGDRALFRALTWLHDEASFPAAGDDTWIPHVANHFYGSSFPAPTPSRPGKAMGFTDWMYGALAESNAR